MRAELAAAKEALPVSGPKWRVVCVLLALPRRYTSPGLSPLFFSLPAPWQGHRLLPPNRKSVPCRPDGSCLHGLPEKAGNGRPQLPSASGAPATPTASPHCLEQSAHGSDKTHLHRATLGAGRGTAMRGLQPPNPGTACAADQDERLTSPMTTEVKWTPCHQASISLAEEGTTPHPPSFEPQRKKLTWSRLFLEAENHEWIGGKLTYGVSFPCLSPVLRSCVIRWWLYLFWQVRGGEGVGRRLTELDLTLRPHLQWLTPWRPSPTLTESQMPRSEMSWALRGKRDIQWGCPVWVGDERKCSPPARGRLPKPAPVEAGGGQRNPRMNRNATCQELGHGHWPMTPKCFLFLPSGQEAWISHPDSPYSSNRTGAFLLSQPGCPFTHIYLSK